MSDGAEYKIELDVFEGPLDLLLYLIKREEVDIYDIPIERITTQYMEYIGLMRMLDLNIAGEFIVMAATLMMIKSRMLLPVEERAENEEEDDEEDPRWDLVRQLVEYKKFKDAASLLQEREFEQENIFALGGKRVAIEPDDPGLMIQDVSLFDLIAAFREVLEHARHEEMHEITGDTFTVADKIDFVLHTVSHRRRLPFTSLFCRDATKHEVICTFLALLELIRLRQVTVKQDSQFTEIVLELAEPEDEVPIVHEDPVAEAELPLGMTTDQPDSGGGTTGEQVNDDKD